MFKFNIKFAMRIAFLLILSYSVPVYSAQSGDDQQQEPHTPINVCIVNLDVEDKNKLFYPHGYGTNTDTKPIQILVGGSYKEGSWSPEDRKPENAIYISIPNIGQESSGLYTGDARGEFEFGLGINSQRYRMRVLHHLGTTEILTLDKITLYLQQRVNVDMVTLWVPKVILEWEGGKKITGTRTLEEIKYTVPPITYDKSS